MTLEQLKEKINSDNFSYKDFEEYYKKLSQEYLEFQKRIEEACEIKKDDRDLITLLKKVKIRNSSELIDKLKNLGYSIRKGSNSAVRDSFSNLGYRLLEQARAGKRDDVYYGFLRIFISARDNFPPDLIEAFKPHYSDEMFKVFIFSFLSGVIGQEEQTSNKEK